jgi:hypothetical protein
MNRLVMNPAERNDEFVADLSIKCAEPEVM